MQIGIKKKRRKLFGFKLDKYLDTSKSTCFNRQLAMVCCVGLYILLYDWNILH